jgi:hypothetical protein
VTEQEQAMQMDCTSMQAVVVVAIDARIRKQQNEPAVL